VEYSNENLLHGIRFMRCSRKGIWRTSQGPWEEWRR